MKTIEIDSVSGRWEDSKVLTDKVAIVPYGGRGQFVAVLALPDILAREYNHTWHARQHVKDVCDKLGTDGCTRTPLLAHQFYNKVYDELCAYGY